MCNNNTDCRCISDILKVISILQKKAVRSEEGDFCDRKTLGAPCCLECNTRPVQIFLCGQNGNDPLVMPTTKGPINATTCFSNVFRVEKVDDCCCTFRVLKEKHGPKFENDLEGSHCTDFVATNSFFTLDLKCACAIRCLEDTFVDCL